MYTLENTRVTAQELMDNEFADFIYNPIEYIKSMNWVVKPNLKKFLEKEAINIIFNAYDVDKLEQLVVSAQATAEDALDVVENNDVHDFLTNCVAGHICKMFDVKKDRFKN